MNRQQCELKAEIERLCVALDWCYAYLPPEDSHVRAQGRSPRFPIIDPIYSREQSVRDTEHARALIAKDGEPNPNEPMFVAPKMDL